MLPICSSCYDRGMDDVKLPDLSRLRDPHDKPKELPPQESAEDTSNWDDRAFSTPAETIDRDLLFVTPEDIDSDSVEQPMTNPYLEQERIKAANRSKNKNL